MIYKLLKLRTLIGLLLCLTLMACSGGNEKDKGSGTGDGLEEAGPVSTESCLNSYDNVFNKPDFYDHGASFAIRKGDAACLSKLIQMGKLDVNQPITGFFESDPVLPIWRAINKNSLFFNRGKAHKIIKVLVDAGANLNIVNENGENPIHVALKHAEPQKYPSVAKYLIKTGKINVDQLDREGNAAINYVVKLKNSQILQSLIEANADLNVKPANGLQPLLTSIMSQWSEGSQQLIKNGADIRIRNFHNKNPLDLSIFYKMNTVSDLLINKMSKDELNMPTHRGAETYLSSAILYKTPAVIKKLLSKGVDVNISSESGNLPLHYVIELKIDEIQELIITNTNKSKINKLNQIGQSALHIASKKGASFALSLLIKNGANVNSVNRADSTPLHLSPNIEITRLLLDAGANINSVNSEGLTPIQISAKAENEPLLVYLINKGANLDGESPNGVKLLNLVVDKNMMQALSLLVTKVNLNIKNKKGKTALFYVKTVDALNVLVSNGADINVIDNSNNSIFTVLVKKCTKSFCKEGEGLDLIKKLTELNINVNHRLDHGGTVLTDVLKQKFSDNPATMVNLLEVLLDTDINLNIIDNDGANAIYYADTVEEIKRLKIGSLSGPVDLSIKSHRFESIFDYYSDLLKSPEARLKRLNYYLSETELEISELGNTQSKEYKILIDKRDQFKTDLRDVMAVIDEINSLVNALNS